MKTCHCASQRAGLADPEGERTARSEQTCAAGDQQSLKPRLPPKQQHLAISRREATTGSRLLTQSADGIFAARADVAQLVEQRFRKPQVTGSNPVVGSLINDAPGIT